MIYTVEISEHAEADLNSIFRYIALELRSVEHATAQIARLEKAVINLEQMPERYRKYRQKLWADRGLRIMPVDNYVVFYTADDRKQLVTVFRVMYGGRDAAKQLVEI